MIRAPGASPNFWSKRPQGATEEDDLRVADTNDIHQEAEGLWRTKTDRKPPICSTPFLHFLDFRSPMGCLKRANPKRRCEVYVTPSNRRFCASTAASEDLDPSSFVGTLEQEALLKRQSNFIIGLFGALEAKGHEM